MNTTNCSVERKVLLILDGHASHTKNIDLIDFARSKGLLLLSLPPHTSHKLQPLDRSCFKPLKAAFNAACGKWMRNHAGRRICPEQIGQLFGEAFYRAATPENAKSGFEASGIVPFNNRIIPEEQYVAIQQAANDTLSVSIEEAASKIAEPQASTSGAGSFIIMETNTSAVFTDILPIPELKKLQQREEVESNQKY